MSTDKVFSELKVLDVGTWIAGPVAGTILADYGADVIKIERPVEGDQYRILSGLPTSPDGVTDYMWQMDGRNKRSIALNIKTDDGIKVLRQLIAECDVYITNQPYSLRRQLGLEFDDVKAIKENVIYASLTAYGEEGPDREREGFDLVAYWARSGLMDLVRDPDGKPAMALPGMGDHPTAVSLYASIVTALLHRERTGEGSMVHTSLLANGIWSASCIAQAGFSGDPNTLNEEGGKLVSYENYRLLKSKRNFAATVYETKDQRWFGVTMIRTPEEIESFFDILGFPDLLNDDRFETPESRFEHGELLSAMATESIQTRDAQQWLADFSAAGLNIVLLAKVEELIDDPMVKCNNMIVAPTDESSPMSYVINHPVNVSSLERVGPTRAPDVGEHSEEVLRGLGYTDDQIEELRAHNII